MAEKREDHAAVIPYLRHNDYGQTIARPDPGRRHQCIEQTTPANIEPVRLNKRIAAKVSRLSIVSPQLLTIDWTSQQLPCFALATESSRLISHRTASSRPMTAVSLMLREYTAVKFVPAP
ncbi:hypothetical protein NKH69_30325 [Mesorhizobium sp. M0976]|uniref:hypothetical protein n=1 Tax=Mesorhizobium sp. M0976 TaxID=2957038 RepID=UPI003336930B